MLIVYNSQRSGNRFFSLMSISRIHSISFLFILPHFYSFRLIFIHSISFYVIVRIYQESTSAVHCHSSQLHSNGRNYAKKAGITKSRKSIKHRNIIWSKKWMKSVFLSTQCINSLFQHGGLALESDHRAANRIFNYLTNNAIHLNMIPAYNAMVRYSLHNRLTKRIQKKLNSQSNVKSKIDSNELSNIINIHHHYKSLDKLRESKLDEFNHGLLYFENINRKQSAYLHGFDAKKSIKKVTKITYNDIGLLLNAINELDFIDNPHDIIGNEQAMDYLRQKLKNIFTDNEIITFIQSEWNESDQDDIDSEEEDINLSKIYKIQDTIDDDEYVLILLNFLIFHLILPHFVSFYVSCYYTGMILVLFLHHTDLNTITILLLNPLTVSNIFQIHL